MTPKDIIKEWFASIDANTIEKNAVMLADNHLFYNPLMPEPANKEQHIELIKTTTAALTGKHILWRTHSDGDFAIAEAQWKGTHTGEFNGIPATGKPVEFAFIDVMEIKNGKIVSEHMELNPMVIMSQIGAA